MIRYIPNYSDSSYIFRVCHTQDSHDYCMNHGLNNMFLRNDNHLCLFTNDGFIAMPEPVIDIYNTLNDGDVLYLHKNGVMDIEYNSLSNDNALVFTLQCNSNCIMCPVSENARKYAINSSFYSLFEKLRYFPRDIKHLTLTGGEPTLLKDDFFRVLKVLQVNFTSTQFQLLTNGRAFADRRFTSCFSECAPDNISLGIPLYGSDSESHDFITQTCGSFEQTIAGIRNLISYDYDIEVRIVLSKMNYKYLLSICRFITERLPRIHSVKIMGLELLGNAAKNYNTVWIPFEEAAKYISPAAQYLVQSGIDLQLYNYPLCSIDRRFWPICAKSITDYKVNYYPECDICKVKEICGGLFSSTKRVAEFSPAPIVT